MKGIWVQCLIVLSPERDLDHVDHCLTLCPFYFDHCIACPSIYWFWLRLLCLSRISKLKYSLIVIFLKLYLRLNWKKEIMKSSGKMSNIICDTFYNYEKKSLTVMINNYTNITKTNKDLSSLPPVVCREVHALFTLYVFVCVDWCTRHIVLGFCYGLGNKTGSWSNS